MKPPIELYLISGFLGAGKTTFLRRILEAKASEKRGVLINEFGDIGIDGKTIDHNGIEYTELSGGSIFCSCIKADFVKAMAALQHTDIDVLYIENSGLADPSSISQLLAEMQPHFERGYVYRGAVSIIDCTAFLRYEKMLPPLQNQVRAADYVILNKTDIADTQTIELVKTRVHALNPGAHVAAAVYADVPVLPILQQLKPHGYAGETTNHPWTRPAVYALAAPGLLKKKALEAFVREIGRYAVRVKGFAQTETGWVHIDAVESDVVLRDANESGETLESTRGIVIIGKSGDAFDIEIKRAWKSHFDTTANFLEYD